MLHSRIRNYFSQFQAQFLSKRLPNNFQRGNCMEISGAVRLNFIFSNGGAETFLVAVINELGGRNYCGSRVPCCSPRGQTSSLRGEKRRAVCDEIFLRMETGAGGKGEANTSLHLFLHVSTMLTLSRSRTEFSGYSEVSRLLRRSI